MNLRWSLFAALLVGSTPALSDPVQDAANAAGISEHDSHNQKLGKALQLITVDGYHRRNPQPRPDKIPDPFDANDKNHEYRDGRDLKEVLTHCDGGGCGSYALSAAGIARQSGVPSACIRMVGSVEEEAYKKLCPVAGRQRKIEEIADPRIVAKKLEDENNLWLVEGWTRAADEYAERNKVTPPSKDKNLSAIMDPVERIQKTPIPSTNIIAGGHVVLLYNKNCPSQEAPDWQLINSVHPPHYEPHRERRNVPGTASQAIYSLTKTCVDEKDERESHIESRASNFPPGAYEEIRLKSLYAYVDCVNEKLYKNPSAPRAERIPNEAFQIAMSKLTLDDFESVPALSPEEYEKQLESKVLNLDQSQFHSLHTELGSKSPERKIFKIWKVDEYPQHNYAQRLDMIASGHFVEEPRSADENAVKASRVCREIEETTNVGGPGNGNQQAPSPSHSRQ